MSTFSDIIIQFIQAKAVESIIDTYMYIKQLEEEAQVEQVQVEQVQVEQVEVEQAQVEQAQVEQAQVEQVQVEQAQVGQDSKTMEFYSKNKIANKINKTLLKFFETVCKSVFELLNIQPEHEEVKENSLAERVEKKQGNEVGLQQGLVGLKQVSESFVLDNAYYLIYGAVQSGKTNILLSICLAHSIMSKCAVVVILRNCKEDEDQLNKRCDDYIEQQNAFFKKEGVAGYKSLKYFYVGKNGKNDKELRNAVINGYMIVAIANKTQLNRLEKALVPGSRYVTLIDEADQVAYGDDSVNFRETLHRSVLKNSGRTYAITATTFNTIFSEERISSSNIIRLPVKEEYRGLEKIQMKALEIDEKNDTTLPEILKMLSDRDAYEHELDDPLHKGHIKNDHPLIMLVKSAHFIVDQHEVAQKIVQIGNWTEVIVFNGKGLTIYTNYISELSEIIKKGNKLLKIKSKNFNIEHKGGKRCIVVKASINCGIQYFRELHLSSVKITHLAIVSGEMADRGISFVSTDYKWHLTTQYYVPSRGAPCDNIIQSIRLCGNYKDDLPSVLYSTKRVCEDLIKSFMSQEEILHRCKYSENELSIPETLQTIPMSTSKVPPRRKFGIRESKINLVEGNDGGFSRRFYKNALKRIEQEEEEESEEEEKENVNSCWIIKIPNKGKNLDIYEKIVTTLKAQPNVWIDLTELRRIFSNKKFNICLHDMKKIEGSSGLLWRQTGGKNTMIEYCWRN
jgi:hypothetical protein